MNLFRPLRGEVSLHMDAPPEQVWALVSDVTRIGEFSPETFEARVDPGLDRPEVGASFKGHVKRNGVGPTYWSPCQVTGCVPNEVFEFAVGTDEVDPQQLGLPARAEANRTGPGTKVTEYFRLEPKLPLRALLDGAWATLRGRTNEKRHAHHAGADEGWSV